MATDLRTRTERRPGRSDREVRKKAHELLHGTPGMTKSKLSRSDRGPILGARFSGQTRPEHRWERPLDIDDQC